MNPIQLSDDDDAVSPVIGVILMVAITVILAAVIATFVLGLGDQVSADNPQASFSFDYESTGGGSGDLEITHDGGAAIPESNIYIRGGSIDEQWGAGSTEVKAGMSKTVNGVSSSTTIRVVWQSDDGEDSATLSDWSGPDA